MIGERVLELRLSKNINLSTLSQLTGLSTNFLFDLENNTVPFTADDIEKIASALDVSKSDIFSQWETDNYDDYYLAITDEDRLCILKYFGVPENLLDTYINYAFKNSSLTKQPTNQNGAACNQKIAKYDEKANATNSTIYRLKSFLKIVFKVIGAIVTIYTFVTIIQFIW